MSKKDMNERMVTEEITKTVREGGIIRQEIIQKPSMSEDALISDIAQGLENIDAGYGLSGFGRFNPDNTKASQRQYQQPKTGVTGFAKFEHQQPLDEGALNFNDAEEDGDALIANAITKSRQQADAVYKPQVIAAFRKIRASHEDFPEDWYNFDIVVNAVVKKISNDLDLPSEMVKTFIMPE